MTDIQHTINRRKAMAALAAWAGGAVVATPVAAAEQMSAQDHAEAIAELMTAKHGGLWDVHISEEVGLVVVAIRGGMPA